MLQNLHVKNLALIDETEVDFRNGLNILSGVVKWKVLLLSIRLALLYQIKQYGEHLSSTLLLLLSNSILHLICSVIHLPVPY